MPGAVRPYTLADIIGQLNDQSSAPTGSIVPLQGFFAPTNETFTLSGTFTTNVQANPGWDGGKWGLVTWN